jgi:hypothetical protein
MNTKNIAVGMLAIVGLVLLLASYSLQRVNAQEQASPAVQKWEYKVVLPESVQDPLVNQAQFNRLGAEGWEMCAVHSSTLPNYCVFKRSRR